MKFYNKKGKLIHKFGSRVDDIDNQSEMIELQQGERIVGMQSTQYGKHSTRCYNL